MNVFRGFSCLMCLVLFAVFSQGASAQCYVQLMGYCANEQFDNPCAEACTLLGANCGMSIDGDPNLNFSDLDGASEGLDEYDTYPYPRFCGYIVKCKCVGGQQGIPFACSATGEQISEYLVTEYYAYGPICLNP